MAVYAGEVEIISPPGFGDQWSTATGVVIALEIMCRWAEEKREPFKRIKWRLIMSKRGRRKCD